MNTKIDITEGRFGRLTAVKDIGLISISGGRRAVAWHCQCDCGHELIVTRSNLVSGRVRSCGCLHPRVTKLNGYNSYSSMIARCNNRYCKDWPRYGGRGIIVCDRWARGDGIKSGAQLFFEDMGERPDKTLSIERIDVNGNYEPGNCELATPLKQARNRRNNYFPPGSDAQAICDQAGVNYGTFRWRVANGQSVDEALTP
jgi:hypothetical protein